MGLDKQPKSPEEVLSVIQYRTGKVLKKAPDLLWIAPLVFAGIGSVKAIHERHKKPLQSIVDTGLVVISIIQAARGLKLASQIASSNTLNRETAAILNDPSSELNQRITRAIEKFKAENPDC